MTIHDRRSFLSCLTTLPLIGGSVALIGSPTASAEPVTMELIEAYKTWLDYEQRMLLWDMAADPAVLNRYGASLDGLDGPERRMPRAREIGRYLAHYGESGSFHHRRGAQSPYKRAALVLSTVGCDWRGGL